MKTNAAALLCFAMLLAPAASASAAASAKEVVDAIGIAKPELTEANIDLGLDHMAAVVDEFGPYEIADPPAALLYTGYVDNLETCMDDDMPGQLDDGDTIEITASITAPADAHSFRFDFAFLTREYPDYVGSQYVDVVQVELRSKLLNTELLYDGDGMPIDVNSPLITLVHSDLTGTGFDGCDGTNRGGATEWFTVWAPCAPGEPLMLTFRVGDVADGIYDSAALLDGFVWSETEIEDPFLFPTGLDEDEDGFDLLEDCDDEDAAVNPDADEVCDNGIDDDCDDLVDEDDPDCDPVGDDDDSAGDDDAADDDAADDDDDAGDDDAADAPGDSSCNGTVAVDWILPMLPLLAAAGLRRRLRVE